MIFCTVLMIKIQAREGQSPNASLTARQLEALWPGMADLEKLKRPRADATRRRFFRSRRSKG